MASDFFYPSIGGVEEHIFNLSQILLQHGHKVIMLTHSYGDFNGVRYLSNGLKVYYLPIKVFYNQCVLPTVLCNVPLIRCVLLRENIEIVHAHSAFSALGHEAMTIAKLMGLKTVFTDHSLFGFADLSAIFTNKMLEIDLSSVNHCICVSHIGKENTVLRARVPTNKVSVIPNAVDTAYFTPDPNQRPTDGTINIVIASRLVYRKGIDLLASIIPLYIDMPYIKFIIVGDGPKRDLLEEVREKFNMQSRVELIGAVEHSKVRDYLRRGHIFLNTSLTEAYCMAIVEAASCGLQVVSTSVGGIPEVLPESLIILVEPDMHAIHQGINKAITRWQKAQKTLSGNHRKAACKKTVDTEKQENLWTKPILCPFKCNELVASLYNWEDITIRTEKVYRRIIDEPNPSLGEILYAYLKSGVWPFLLVISMCHLLLRLLEYFRPSKYMEKARDFKSDTQRTKTTRNQE